MANAAKRGSSGSRALRDNLLYLTIAIGVVALAVGLALSDLDIEKLFQPIALTGYTLLIFFALGKTCAAIGGRYPWILFSGFLAIHLSVYWLMLFKVPNYAVFLLSLSIYPEIFLFGLLLDLKSSEAAR